MIDPNLKTPYSIIMSANFQQQFPARPCADQLCRPPRPPSARAGRRQPADRLPGQDLRAAHVDGHGQRHHGAARGADPTNLPAQPWFENQVRAGHRRRASAIPTTPPSSPTSCIAHVQRRLRRHHPGAPGLLDYNVGMAPQFSQNTFYTNKGFSSYNGLLVTLQKNLTPRPPVRRELHLVALHRQRLRYANITVPRRLRLRLRRAASPARAAATPTSTSPSTSPATSPTRCPSAVAAPSAATFRGRLTR